MVLKAYSPINCSGSSQGFHTSHKCVSSIHRKEPFPDVSSPLFSFVSALLSFFLSFLYPLKKGFKVLKMSNFSFPGPPLPLQVNPPPPTPHLFHWSCSHYFCFLHHFPPINSFSLDRQGAYLVSFFFFLPESSPWSGGMGGFCLLGVASNWTCLAQSLARRPPRPGDTWLSGPVCEDDAQLLMQGVPPPASSCQSHTMGR